MKITKIDIMGIPPGGTRKFFCTYKEKLNAQAYITQLGRSIGRKFVTSYKDEILTVTHVNEEETA